MKLHLEFDHRPSVIAFMLRGFLPSAGRLRDGGFPPIRVSWRRHRIDRDHLAEFRALAGLPAEDGVPLLYPHVSGFPLQMVILTHPAFPLPIWGALQVRNHLVRHRTIPVDATVDVETRVAFQRILEKGAEVDLHTTVRSRDEPVWESLNTFYYRGRFGPAGTASRFARAPAEAGAVTAEWDAAAGGGRRFAALTGDYNGIHHWGWYARRFGFRQAFFHPQVVLGQCLARLPAHEAGAAQRLDAWLKGPVYYGSRVSLRSAPDSDGLVFAAHADGDARPAVIGRRSSPSGSHGAPFDPDGATDLVGAVGER